MTLDVSREKLTARTAQQRRRTLMSDATAADAVTRGRMTPRAYDRTYSPNRPLRVGYVGNLLMKYVDRATVSKIVKKHPGIEFHFWCPRTPAESDVSSANSVEVREFVQILASSRNVLLHGPLPSERLAKAIGDMDALLVCYDVVTDPNRGCNSHKILEYLSTGRVIIANHISDYANRPDLIDMLPSVDKALMPELLASVVCGIMNLNGREEQQVRRAYALENSYVLQIERIESSLRSSVAEMAAAGAAH